MNYQYREGTIYNKDTKTYYSYEDFTQDEWTNLYKDNKQYTYDEWMAYYKKNENKKSSNTNKNENKNTNDDCTGYSNYRYNSNCNNRGGQGNYGGGQSNNGGGQGGGNRGGYHDDDSYDDDYGPWTGFHSYDSSYNKSKATSSNSSSVAIFLGFCALCLVAIGFFGAKYFGNTKSSKEKSEIDAVDSQRTNKIQAEERNDMQNEERKGVVDPNMSCDTSSDYSFA